MDSGQGTVASDYKRLLLLSTLACGGAVDEGRLGEEETQPSEWLGVRRRDWERSDGFMDYAAAHASKAVSNSASVCAAAVAVCSAAGDCKKV